MVVSYTHQNLLNTPCKFQCGETRSPSGWFTNRS